MANQLKFESSPYLKQHQNNPVHWYPWGEEALHKAKKENKLIIISIGYAACHWCHVMERESFEDELVAKVMNDHFIAIKVDREERPDIDQVYMTAVQLMKGQGGWPLNAICLPDTRPIYGGTYFRPDDWKNVLLQLVETWNENPEVALDYAQRLTQGIHESDAMPVHQLDEPFQLSVLHEIVDAWKGSFDKKEGGYKRVPKFPIPNNWLFFLRYGFLAKDEEVLKHAHFTLKKIASGGIYDQVGGGFARYSVDSRWHIPHFEKMLYDNALLVSLYCEAYQQRPTPLYKRVVYETLAWVKREMTNTEGAFYSSLDADSDGVEGKYYTFAQQEITEVLGEDAPLFIDYFQVTEKGNWLEENTNVLELIEDADTLARDAGYSELEWDNYLKEIKLKLFHYREKRNRPALDNKIICSWNAMMIKAYIDAYRVFQEDEFLESAKTASIYIDKELFNENGDLLRQPAFNGKEIVGFLDDHAFYIEVLITLYETTFQIDYLEKARMLIDKVLIDFKHDNDTAFNFTSHHAEKLIANKKDIMDDVIPSSNSVLIRQLFKLGLFFDNDSYRSVAMQVLINVFPQIKTYPSAFSNWSIQILEEVFGLNEVAITGPDYQQNREELDKHYLPNKITMGGQNENLPLLHGRIDASNKIYVCKNKTCSLPVSNIPELLKLIFKPENGQNSPQS
jgi:uncharacterized protein YyaL (SSP411 family)